VNMIQNWSLNQYRDSKSTQNPSAKLLTEGYGSKSWGFFTMKIHEMKMVVSCKDSDWYHKFFDGVDSKSQLDESGIRHIPYIYHWCHIPFHGYPVCHEHLYIYSSTYLCILYIYNYIMHTIYIYNDYMYIYIITKCMYVYILYLYLCICTVYILYLCIYILHPHGPYTPVWGLQFGPCSVGSCAPASIRESSRRGVL